MTDADTVTLARLKTDRPTTITIDGIEYKIKSRMTPCHLIDPYLFALSVFPPAKIIPDQSSVVKFSKGRPRDNPTVVLVIDILKRLGLSPNVADDFLSAEYGAIQTSADTGLNFTELCSWSTSIDTTARSLHSECADIFGTTEYSFADILALHFRGEAEDTGARVYGIR